MDSRRVADYCVAGTAVLLTSIAVEDELATAPERVQQLFKTVPAQHREEVPVGDDVNDLADAYLAAGVVGTRSREDCLHVAAATVRRADAIVSWNFKQIVRLDRIRAFNAVNLAEGYGIVRILSPKEVNLDE